MEAQKEPGMAGGSNFLVSFATFSREVLLSNCPPWRPGLLNSIVALVMILVNVYTAQEGNWSVTAIVAVCIVGCWSAGMGLTYAVYELWILRELKRED